MTGYWQRPDETAKVIDKDGWFATGDVGVMDETRLRADRRSQEGHDPGLRLQRVPERDRGRAWRCIPACSNARRSASPTTKSGEAVKLFVVKKDPALTADDAHPALPRAPHRLQGAARRRVPHRAAEDQRRQDPAPRAARRGQAEAAMTPARVPATGDDPTVHASRQGSRCCASCRCRRREPARRHLRRLDHGAGRHRGRRGGRATCARSRGHRRREFVHVQAARCSSATSSRSTPRSRASDARRSRSTSRCTRSAIRSDQVTVQGDRGQSHLCRGRCNRPSASSAPRRDGFAAVPG